ncbi:hypothetical protein BD289DRAFT_478502 [Coniella lustricola]|uniref:Uncharacterized protein n=1 Tax=Coniella lustricola TaxID=2025994 RepID=A0A2T3AMP5_9PEZI|nr:hypothetical protein BD289DRAFT_478502 [Coniella lustricola]
MSALQDPMTLFRQGRFATPKTPEPVGERECQTPCTPRPRLRLRRRQDAQHLAAPTQQFLASVAAADIPIPSIEEPAIADFETEAFPLWSDFEQHVDEQTDSRLAAPFGGPRLSTPPKTPLHIDLPSLTPSRYPSWTVDWMSSCESSPEPTSRPSTSRSTRTSSSSFSQLSCFSDEDLQFSPSISATEDFLCFDLEEPDTPSTPGEFSRHSRKAPWTKAMSAHLWATYNMYLSDPRVTPFQIGKSGIPPEGVCKRVAREAARSWKGSKAVARPASAIDVKSGNSTPTVEASGAFIEWPHTAAATRAQLRVLCKQKARGVDGGKMRFSYLSRSPTPFSDDLVGRWARRQTAGSHTSTFDTRNLATSLAVTTSDAMNPQGPLAQLTDATPVEPVAARQNLEQLLRSSADAGPSFEDRRCLGSILNAKSYGPSASALLGDAYGVSSDTPQRQVRTVSGARPQLQSPVHISRSSTQQKRKTGQTHETCKRPSLSSDLWLDPSSISRNAHVLAHKKSFSLSSGEDSLFASRLQPQLFIDTASVANRQPAVPMAVPMALPQRLGSPLSISGSSFSVPNRTSQPSFLDSSIFGRPFSTIHHSTASQPTEPARINLAARLAYIDRRLKDFNSPERSEPPW